MRLAFPSVCMCGLNHYWSWRLFLHWIYGWRVTAGLYLWANIGGGDLCGLFNCKDSLISQLIDPSHSTGSCDSKQLFGEHWPICSNWLLRRWFISGSLLISENCCDCVTYGNFTTSLGYFSWGHEALLTFVAIFDFLVFELFFEWLVVRDDWIFLKRPHTLWALILRKL